MSIMNYMSPQNISRPDVGVPRPQARGFEGNGGPGQGAGDLGVMLSDNLLLNQVKKISYI